MSEDSIERLEDDVAIGELALRVLRKRLLGTSPRDIMTLSDVEDVGLIDLAAAALEKLGVAFTLAQQAGSAAQSSAASRPGDQKAAP